MVELPLKLALDAQVAAEPPRTCLDLALMPLTLTAKEPQHEHLKLAAHHLVKPPRRLLQLQLQRQSLTLHAPTLKMRLLKLTLLPALTLKTLMRLQARAG